VDVSVRTAAHIRSRQTYYELMDEFMWAVTQRWPKAMVQVPRVGVRRGVVVVVVVDKHGDVV
jgi:hypothetical protein